MVEFERNQERQAAASQAVKICVAGVGAGGLNILDRISLDRMMEATLLSLHTDVRVLNHSMSPVKIQLGTDVMKGIGSGGDPELGREAANSSREQIVKAVAGHDMVFLCCGLGGGTGSGAAPIVAEIAKENGAMVFVFATMPFSFEGRRRHQQADVSLKQLRNTADALILFENDRMGELVLPKEGIQKAFSQADQLIGHSVRAISTMVTQPGIVRMGLADLMTALRSPDSRCLFGFGEARGNNRVTESLKRALKSPLVNQGLLLQNARNLLVHVAGGESLTLAEVENLMKQLGKYVPEETQIMFGLAVDARMGDSLSLTLISSLSASEIALDAVDTTPAKVPAIKEESPAASVEAAQPPVETPAPAPVQPQAQVAPVQQPVAAPVTARKKEARVQEPVVETPAPVAAAPAPEVDQGPTLFEVLQAMTPVAAAPAPATPQAAAPAPVPALVLPPALEVEPVHQELPPSVPALAPVHTPVIREERIEIVKEVVIHAAPLPAPAASSQPVAPAPTEEAPAETHISSKSIFSIVDEQDDGEDEESDADDDSSHWADKYIQPKEASAPPVITPRRDPEPALVSNAGPAKSPTAFQQGSFNLNQEEVTRFKGTDKTVVEGEDLDVPTWMRLRQKLKRQS